MKLNFCRAIAQLCMITLLLPFTHFSSFADDEIVIINRPLDGEPDGAQIRFIPPHPKMAIGEVFKVQTEVQGFDPGERINARIKLGSTTLSLVMNKLILPDAKDETGPWLYESEAIEVFVSATPHSAQNILTEYTQASVNLPVEGITGQALTALIEDYLERIEKSRHPLEILVLLEKLSSLINLANDPALYQYVALKLQTFAQRSPLADLLNLNADEYLATAAAILNQRLYAQLDQISSQTLDNPRPANLDERNVLRALVLIKDTGLAWGTQRLVELNRWKRGSGIIARDTLLTKSSQEIMSRLRTMKSADEAKRFLATSGIANSENQLLNMRNTAAQYAQQHKQELQSIWAQMLTAREWYQWANRQINLVFDWEASQRRYANQYLAAEQQYNELLQQYDLLKTMINDTEGNLQPLWTAISSSQNNAQIQSYFDQAVDNNEKAVREMMGNLVEMRSKESLIELGGQKYKELHSIARSSGAPNANALVGLARGTQEQATGESSWKKAAWDFGLGVVQIGGILFPPAFYAATAVQIGRKGEEVVVAYGETNRAETTETAGVGSALETDNARRNLQRSIGDLALESVFGAEAAATKLESVFANEITSIKIFSAAVRVEKTTANITNNVARLRAISNEMKEQLAAQTRFQQKIAELETSIQRAEEMAIKKRTKIEEWDRKIKDALNDGDEVLRDQRMAKRANDQRILVGWRTLARDKASELRALREAGPSVSKPRLYTAIQGQDVERATRQFYERLSQNSETTFVEKLANNRYQLGEKLPASGNQTARRRFEVRLNGTITDTQGRTIKPPEKVKLPNEVEPVANPAADRQSMIFDRIIIDHKEKVIYLEDLIRTGNREHLIKTHSYAPSLERMFPGYRVGGVVRQGVGHWPRDIVWGNMNSPISAISADLRPYKVQHGISQPTPGH